MSENTKPNPGSDEAIAQGEMPDEVDRACDLLEWSGNVNAAAALRDAWLAHSQPVAVGMTEELDAILDYAIEQCDEHDAISPARAETHHMRACIAAVRQQAAQVAK